MTGGPLAFADHGPSGGINGIATLRRVGRGTPPRRHPIAPRAQVVAPEATLVGAGDIASCNYNRDYDTAKVVDSTITSANAPVTVFTLGDNAYPDGNTNQYKNCYDPTW
ncbi:MAG: hypothetical protein ACJ73J_12650, partial [Actinomycetes bacterium]